MQRFIPLACWVTLASCTASDVSDSDPSDGNASSEGEGETGEGEGETGEGEGETGEGEGEGEPVLCTPTPGTRLQLHQIAALDWVSRLVDPVADSECRIRRWDNVCEPTDVAEFSGVVYRTAPEGDFFINAETTAPTTPFWYYGLLLVVADFFTYEPDTAYIKNGQEEPYQPIPVAFHAARRLIVFDAVTFTTVVPPGQTGRLQHQVLQGSDGTVLCMDTLFDTQTQSTCRPITVDGNNYKCMPIEEVITEHPRFADTNCTDGIAAYTSFGVDAIYGTSQYRIEQNDCRTGAHGYSLSSEIELYAIEEDTCTAANPGRPATLVSLDTFANLKQRQLDGGALTRIAFVSDENIAVLSTTLYDRENDRPCSVEDGVCTSYPNDSGDGFITKAYEQNWFSDENCSERLYFSYMPSCENHTIKIDEVLHDATPYSGVTYARLGEPAQCTPFDIDTLYPPLDFTVYRPGAVLSVVSVMETPLNP